ncbi:hypothetical protein KNU02_gp14 [Gordonia phage Pleakley]|uniref:Uncharacterized protein n=1 Tax=Gordonia phage Pleakley TaxID=2283246 RepID=A0A345M6D2_9CAUD|nr:hypothetical protein KNU02_gp14 [Gordonia phage Pleakley]AXH49740.1 hypothetical protein SEA_FURY_14 [Gordonia phage Fury]AXH66053.1 hypothetical protein SEA_PLEAKLEY_14 [Gordonia phage Pleakley]
MSTPGSPSAVAPTDALRALLQQCQMNNGPLRDNESLIDGFLADWLVMKSSDYQFDLARQAEWQQEAKLAFAVLITAMSNVNNQYPMLNLGPRVLEEAERLIRQKGLDPDEVLQRFLP